MMVLDFLLVLAWSTVSRLLDILVVVLALVLVVVSVVATPRLRTSAVVPPSQLNWFREHCVMLPLTSLFSHN